jgi:outer membrane receptor protein involved in Fe transport
LSFSFPVTDRTVFYAQYGKYAQMPRLDQIYRGLVNLSSSVSPKSRGNAYLTPVGFLIRPERTTQYEMGIRQTLSDNFAFTLSGFYKDTKDQIQVRLFRDNTSAVLYQGYLNDDFGTVKGIELTFELRRTNRFAARLNYTLSDTRGTASDSRSGWGAIEQNIGRSTNYVNQLDYNQTHRGSLLLDYRYDVGEGGPILSGLGANFLVTFNSGHPYTKQQPLKELGQADAWGIGVEAVNDRRFSFPAEPVNASTTPFFLNIDFGLSKMFNAGPVKMELYAQVTNLLNTKQVLNVYPTTGSAEDDGWLTNPLAGQFNSIPNYAAFYRAINLENRWAAMTITRFPLGDFYGTPRAIRVGLRAEI